MTMTLLEAIDAYITLKRSLGAVFRADTRVLRSFGRAFGDISLGAIDPKAVHDLCRGKGPPTPWWERKDTALRGFFAYLVSRGYLAACPLPEQRPRVTRSFRSLLKCVWVAAAPVLCLHSRGTASRSTRRASGSHRRDARSPAACC